MKRIQVLIITSLILLTGIGNAQNVAINETGAAAHGSAILHVQSTTKGLLIPSMTTAQRNAIVSTATGLLVFDVQTQSFWFLSTGNQWKEIRDVTDDRFIDGTFGMYTTESGIGVGASPIAASQKFYGVDSLNNPVHLALHNKHASGNTALYLVDNAGLTSGTFEFDNASEQLYIQNGQSATGGDIIFRTNQFPETGNSEEEVLRIKRLGGLGVGTSSPGARLHISNAASAIGLRIDNTINSSATTYSIFSDNNTDGTGKKYAAFNRVFGKATSQEIYGSANIAFASGHPMDAYAGYFQIDTAGTGTHYGVYTEAKGVNDYALYSYSDNVNGWAGYFVGRTYVSGRLGVGIENPEHKVHIVNGTKQALNIETDHSSAMADTVYGIHNLILPTGNGTHYGLYSKVELDPANSKDAYGVRGQVEPDGTGLHYGVFGRANGDENIGVYGVSTLTGIGVKGVNTNTNGWAGYFDGKAYIEDRLEIRDGLILRPSGSGNGGEIELYDNDGDQTFTIRSAQTTDNGAHMQMYNDDNELTLILDAEGSGDGGAIILSDNEGDETVYIRAGQSTTNGAEMLMHNDAGTLTIELDADFNSGKGRVITDELEITGGSDLAEHFDILQSDILVPGMLVSVDPSGSGKLVPTQSAYDRKVAGVVSGANGVSPGMLMGQRASIADGDFPVALAGRVYVLADASDRSINPGDLMTSSNRPGYAMSVKLQKRAQGAVIGKALTGMKDGTGYVLILVNLQ